MADLRCLACNDAETVVRIVDAPDTPGFCFCARCLGDLDGGRYGDLAQRMIDTFPGDISRHTFWSWHTTYEGLAAATERHALPEPTPKPPAVIETVYLRLPADDPALLRDFIARAEADLAREGGLSQTWPAFSVDVRRAVELARAAEGGGVMDTATTTALRDWAELTYQECNDAYQRAPVDAPLSEWAETMTEQLRSLSWLLSSQLAAEHEQPDAELDRLASDLEAERAGTAGMQAYTRQLEGLLRRVADAWNSDGGEAGENLVEIETVVEEWQRLDPEHQG